MSNKKLILGIAAGVAALAVVGVVLKRRGHLDNLGERAEEFGGSLKDKLASLKETAKSKFDDLKQKGGEYAEEAKDKFEDLKQKGTDAAGKLKQDANNDKSGNTTTGSNPATV